MSSKLDRDIANRHHGCVKWTRVKEILSGNQIGPETKDAIEYALYLMLMSSKKRAEANGRTRLFPHDVAIFQDKY